MRAEVLLHYFRTLLAGSNSQVSVAVIIKRDALLHNVKR